MKCQGDKCVWRRLSKAQEALRLAMLYKDGREAMKLHEEIKKLEYETTMATGTDDNKDVAGKQSGPAHPSGMGNDESVEEKT